MPQSLSMMGVDFAFDSRLCVGLTLDIRQEHKTAYVLADVQGVTESQFDAIKDEWGYVYSPFGTFAYEGGRVTYFAAVSIGRGSAAQDAWDTLPPAHKAVYRRRWGADAVALHGVWCYLSAEGQDDLRDFRCALGEVNK